MKILFRFFLLVGAVLALAACPLMTRDDIQQQEEDRQLKQQLSSIQQSKADSEMKYGDMQNDLRIVAGRVDALDHNQVVGQKSHQQDMESLKKLIDTQNEKIRLLEQHLDATETRLTAAIQALSNQPAPQTPVSSATSEERGGKKSAGAKKADGGPLFNEAEEYFQKKDFKKAIVKYQAYRDKNAKGAKLAEATYKIGVCFQELGMKSDAKEFFQETMTAYAGSPSAKKAKFRITQLK